MFDLIFEIYFLRTILQIKMKKMTALIIIFFNILLIYAVDDQPAEREAKNLFKLFNKIHFSHCKEYSQLGCAKDNGIAVS